MSVVANVFAPEIEICGTGESLTGSLNVAVIVTILPDVYGPGEEYVMAAVGGVASSIISSENIGETFPAASLISASTSLVPSPAVKVTVF